jgi:hypothetical protein
MRPLTQEVACIRNISHKTLSLPYCNLNETAQAGLNAMKFNFPKGEYHLAKDEVPCWVSLRSTHPNSYELKIYRSAPSVSKTPFKIFVHRAHREKRHACRSSPSVRRLPD